MNVVEILYANGFYKNRLIAGSKTRYRKIYTDHLIMFNANIVTDDGKIWYGDLNINIDEEKLKKVAKESKKDLYILYEMDARFEHEKDSVEVLKSKAIVIFNKDGNVWKK